MSRDEDIRSIRTAIAKISSEGGLSRVGDWFTDATLESVANAALDAHLTALEASGRAVVPRDPTQAMAKAGYEACCNIPRTGVVPENIERAYDCWVAMVNAASPPPHQNDQKESKDE